MKSEVINFWTHELKKLLDGTNCKVFSPVIYYVFRLETMTSLANPEEKSIQNDAGEWRHKSVILM